MKKLAPTLALVLLPTLALADKGDPSNVQSRQLTALRTAAKCEDKASPWRPWCIAADFDKGTAADLPKGKVLVGLTVTLEDGKDAADALRDKVSFAALAVEKDGKIKVTSVTPSNESETKMMAEAVMSTAVVFKGKAKTAKIPKELAGYLKTLKGTYDATKSGAEWTWAGQSAAKLRKVGAYWVAIEMPAKGDGIFATIFTDAWQ